MSAMVIIQLSLKKIVGKVITDLITIHHINIVNSSTHNNILRQGTINNIVMIPDNKNSKIIYRG